MKTFRISVPMYKCEPLFVFDCGLPELDRYLKRKFNVAAPEAWKADPCTDGGSASYEQDPWYLVWFRKLKRNSDASGLMVHELFHLTVSICSDKGIPVSQITPTGQRGDEAAAYLIDYLMCELVKRAKPSLRE